MNNLFVTASGTEIGKTFVTQVLVAQLRAVGRRVHALKPIATGFDPRNAELSDSKLLLNALEADASGVASITPWHFKAPLSPDMAAAREGHSIPFDDLIAFCEVDYGVDLTLIEGIGGVMVPLDDRHCVLDWIEALRAPTLLVAGSYLGTLSHTLTAVGMLRARGIEIAGIVVNESPEAPVTTEKIAEALARFTGDTPIRVLNRVNRPADAPDLLPLIMPYL